MNRIPLLLLALLLSTVINAHPARAYDAWRERAVVVDDHAYLLGKPEAVIPGDVGWIAVSPNGRYLIVERETPLTNYYLDGVVPPATSDPPLHTQYLYLISTHRQDPVLLWKGSADPSKFLSVGNIAWLADGQTALTVVGREADAEDTNPATGQRIRKYDSQLLVINAPQHSVRTLRLGTGESDVAFVDLVPSPIRPEVVMTYRVGRAGPYRVRLVSATGELSAPIDEPASYLSFTGWDADGNIATAFDTWVTPATPGDPLESTARQISGYLQFDRRDHSTHRSMTPPRETGFRSDSKDIQSLRLQKLPLRLVAQSGVVSTAALRREGIACVYLEAARGSDRVFVAAEATPVTILGTGPNYSLIYRYAGALFAEPVTRVSHAAYVEYVRKQFDASARQINAALDQWMLDNNTHLPPQGDLVSALVGEDKYIRSDAGMRDPTTGKINLTYFTSNAADATGGVPVLSLSTSVGRCILYRDGKIVWEPISANSNARKE